MTDHLHVWAARGLENGHRGTGGDGVRRPTVVWDVVRALTATRDTA